ncbi:MAG: hypothetical protein N4A33_00080 [Bacteriovoracaceae bacterium]|jgi:hypothetical protein|nr:hypothetical protein [Bacteriovoracaceae bacterium]
MAKLFKLLLTLLFLISCGNDVNNTGTIKQINPNDDSDLDGKSNIEEYGAGTEAFINKNIVPVYLDTKKSMIYLEYSDEIIKKEKLVMINSQSARIFLYNEFLKYNLKEQSSKAQTLTMGVLGCIPKETFRSLNIKYGYTSPRLINLITSFNNSNIKDTDFYVYDFKTMNRVVYVKKKDGQHISYSIDFKNYYENTGVCILYKKKDTNSMAIKNSIKVLIKDNNLYQVAILTKDVYDSQTIIQKFKTTDYKVHKSSHNYILMAKDNTHISQKRFYESNKIVLNDIYIGDTIKLNINSISHISNSNIMEKRIYSDRRYKSSKIWEMKKNKNCGSFHRPRLKDVFSQRNLDDFGEGEMTIKIGAIRAKPIFRSYNNFSYEIKITKDMLKEGKVIISIIPKSKTKYKYLTHNFSKLLTTATYRWRCHYNFNNLSSFKNTLVLKHNVKLDIIRN